MNELIVLNTSTIGDAAVQTVNARDLHAFIESKQQFGNWIQNQIEAYDFTQDVDFTVINNFISDDTAFGGKRKTIDYHLTIDAAKELAMVERNAKGKQARQYFIECERKAKQPANIYSTLKDPAQMRHFLLHYVEKTLELEEKVAEQAPKVDVHDRLVDADGAINPTLAAKTLQTNPKKLFDLMRASKWIYRRPGGSGNVAYQDKIQAGYLTHKVTTVQREDGTDKIIEQVLVTPKGLTKLAQMLAA